MPGACHRARPPGGREAVGPSSTRLRQTGHRTVSGANKPCTPPFPIQNSPRYPCALPVPIQTSSCTSRAVPLAVQNSPCASRAAAFPVQNSPCSPKMALFGAFSSCSESFFPLPPTTSPARHRYRYKTRPARPKWPISARFAPAGRTLYRHRHQQAEQGEVSTACASWPQCPWAAGPALSKNRMQFDYVNFQ